MSKQGTELSPEMPFLGLCCCYSFWRVCLQPPVVVASTTTTSGARGVVLLRLLSHGDKGLDGRGVFVRDDF